MAHWTSLRRYDVALLHAAASRGLGLEAFVDDERAAIEEITTKRAWHAIHVGLTGREEGGEEPMVLALWGGRDAELATYSEAWFVHRPNRVRQIAEFLDTVDSSALFAALDRAIADGVDVYSLDAVWLELAETYADLRRFYRAAADAGELVVVSRC